MFSLGLTIGITFLSIINNLSRKICCKNNVFIEFMIFFVKKYVFIVLLMCP